MEREGGHTFSRDERWPKLYATRRPHLGISVLGTPEALDLLRCNRKWILLTKMPLQREYDYAMSK